MRPTVGCLHRMRIRTLAPRIRTPSRSTPMQRSIRAAYYRGGTSRAIILDPRDLPPDRRKWPHLFRQLMGSGDPFGRQLDGMGAGISSLSKICLVEASRTLPPEGDGDGDGDGTHVDYTFVGMGIEDGDVDTAGSCGNMSSAIGPYAYNARLLPTHLLATRFGQVTVKIRNTNTDKLIDSTFLVANGQAAVLGDYSIDGVTDKGSMIRLDFRDPYGSKTGRTLPTMKRVDVIDGYRVTCVDGPNPAVFIRASDIGVDGTILPNDFARLRDKLDVLEKIRKGAAVAMGLAETEAEVARTIPKIGIVSMSSTHPVLSGETLRTSQMDLAVRFISDTQPHRAIPLTAALTTAIAARIPGTIVEGMLAPDPVMEDAITIGHASGRLQVNATMDSSNPLTPLSATVYRTAKRLFEGNMYWTDKEGNSEAIENHVGDQHSLGLKFVMECRGQDISQLSETRDDTGKPSAEPSASIQRRQTSTGGPHKLEEHSGRQVYRSGSKKESFEHDLMRLREVVRGLSTVHDQLFKSPTQNTNKSAGNTSSIITLPIWQIANLPPDGRDEPGKGQKVSSTGSISHAIDESRPVDVAKEESATFVSCAAAFRSEASMLEPQAEDSTPGPVSTEDFSTPSLSPYDYSATRAELDHLKEQAEMLARTLKDRGSLREPSILAPVPEAYPGNAASKVSELSPQHIETLLRALEKGLGIKDWPTSSLPADEGEFSRISERASRSAADLGAEWHGWARRLHNRRSLTRRRGKKVLDEEGMLKMEAKRARSEGWKLNKKGNFKTVPIRWRGEKGV